MNLLKTFITVNSQHLGVSFEAKFFFIIGNLKNKDVLQGKTKP